MHQAKQQRSLQKQQALLAAGRDLLKSHELPTLSVAQVAAAAGVAVGSFYARFEDKNAWFAELSREAAFAAFADLEQLLASAALHDASATGKVSLLMHWLVQVHRDHQGIFRAAVSDPARTQLYWAPLMRLCARVDGLVYALLAPDLHPASEALGQTRVSFAFQMVFSTLLNAVVHDAGPVRLHDPALAPELARSFLASVGFTAPAG
jgi:AcrR family transcriptional regulator